MPNQRSHTHQQISNSAEFMMLVSEGAFSLKEQAIIKRLSIHINQLHAIIPMVDVVNELGLVWEEKGTIPTSAAPWRGAIQHLLSTYEVPPSETLRKHSRLATQIQHGQQLITSYLQQDNIVPSLLKSNSVTFTRKYLDRIVALLYFRDDLYNLAERQGLIAHHSPFTTAWDMTSFLAETYKVSPPINADGENTAPMVPLNGDDSLTHCHVHKMLIADTLPEIQSQIRSLQDEALKAGIPALEMHATGHSEMRPLVMYRDNKEIPIARLPTLFLGFDFNMVIPQINQAKFLGRVQKNKGQLTLLAASERARVKLAEAGITADSVTMKCSHCGNAREKHTTYLVENNVGVREIGHSCLDVFVGRPALKKVALSFKYIEFINDSPFWDSINKRYASAQRTPSYFPMEEYVYLAAMLTQKHGFVKSDSPQNTRDAIIHVINHPEDSDLLPMPSSGKKIAADIVGFYRNLKSNSDYVNKMKEAINSDVIKLDNRMFTGIIASAPASYFKHTGQGNVINEPFGQLKARGPLKLHVYGVEEFEDQEFPVVKYKMRDDQGRRFTWKATWPGNELLEIGKTVSLTGTIKKHFEWEGQHFTHLNRCSDITLVDRNAPAPDFNKGASKRAFKETFDFRLLPYKEGGVIDGQGYVHINRSWREDNVVREFNGTIALPLTKDSAENIVALIAQKSGVDRKTDGSNVDLKNKKDRKFLKAFRELHGFYDKSIPPMKNVFWVDDAFAPWFTPQPNRYGAKQATPDERIKRRPQLFTQVSEAINHGRKLTAGRRIELSLNTPKFTMAPVTLRLQDEITQGNFRKRAIEQGCNVLILCDDEGKIKRIEPLNWHNLTPGEDFTIHTVEVDHKPQNQSLESQSKRFLGGHHFIAISGLESQPDLMISLKKHLREIELGEQFGDDRVSLDTFSETLPSNGGSPYATSLCFLSDENNRRLSKRNWLMFVTDSATTYYLRLFGAEVIDVTLNIGRKLHDREVPSDAIVLNHFRFNEKKITEEVITQVNDEIKKLNSKIRPTSL